MIDSLRLAIVDELPLFRDGVCSALAAAFRNLRVGHGTNERDAVRLARDLNPNLFLISLGDPERAAAVTRSILATRPECKVIFLTMPGQEKVIQEVLRVGARGCIAKTVDAMELLRCVQAVHLGESYVSPAIAAQLLGRAMTRATLSRNDDSTPLTERELKIMQEVAHGLTNKEIAAKFALSENTVKRYMTQIMQKLHARNRLEALLLLRSQGCTKHPL